MCGRYTLTIDKSTIEHRFDAKFYIAKPSYDWSMTFQRRAIADAAHHLKTGEPFAIRARAN